MARIHSQNSDLCNLHFKYLSDTSCEIRRQYINYIRCIDKMDSRSTRLQFTVRINHLSFR